MVREEGMAKETSKEHHEPSQMLRPRHNESYVSQTTPQIGKDAAFVALVCLK
jgi:hypothetical protein